MKNLFLSSFIIITSFFFVNSVGASRSSDNSYFMRIDEFTKYIMSDEEKNNIDSSSKEFISSLISSIKNDYYYFVAYRSNTIEYAYWPKTTNDYILYFNFTYMDDKIYVSLYKTHSSHDIMNEQKVGSSSYHKGLKNGVDILMNSYDLNTKKTRTGNYRLYETNCPVIQFTSEPNYSTTYPVNKLYFEDDIQCYYDLFAVEGTVLFDENHEFVLKPDLKPHFNLSLTKNYDDYNNVISEDVSLTIEYCDLSSYSLAYQFVEDGSNLVDYMWLPILPISFDSSNNALYNIHISKNGKLYLGYEKNGDTSFTIENSLNVFGISSIDMISIDITNTEGIVLIPKTDSSRYSSNIFFSAPEEFINQYKSNENFYFKYSNRSLHLANVNNFDINDLYSQEKLINNFSPGDSLTEIIDKNNYNISLFRAEKPDYIVSNDRPMIISFDRNVYNYQVLGENGSDSDNTTIIDPNTGKPIIVDSFKETDFFTLMKHAFSRFKSVIRNIFKLVSTFFYSLPSTLNYFFVLVMFFIVLLLFLKFLI